MERLQHVARHAILIVWACICLFPIFWMVSMAFKPADQWTSTNWLPEGATLDNFRALFAPGTLPEQFRELILGATLNALHSIRDSLIIGVGATIGAVVVGGLAAYAISRFQVGGKTLAFNVLTVRMLPAIVVIIPLLIMFSQLGLLDTYRGLILVNMGVTVPYVVWLMKSFFDDIPASLEEAAVMDGSSRLGALWRISLPLSAAGIAVTALFVFILVWTEFLVGLTLTLNKITPIPVQIAKYQSATGGTLYGIQAALATVAILPPLVFGLAIQRYLVTGLTFGAIKR